MAMAEMDPMDESPKSTLNMSLDDIIASNRRIADAANRTHHITPNRLGSSPSRKRRRNPTSFRAHSSSSTSYRNNSNGRHRGQSPRDRWDSPGRRSAKTPRDERWESPGGRRTKTPRGRQESPGGRSWKVHVSNVGSDVSESILKRHFSKAGKVLDCSMHYNQDGEHQGTAVVAFSSERGAHAAVDQFHGVLFYGYPLHLVVLEQ